MVAELSIGATLLGLLPVTLIVLSRPHNISRSRSQSSCEALREGLLREPTDTTRS